MRLGLIGATGHWHTYAPALQNVPHLSLIAVSIAGPEETVGTFDHAPGLTPETRRYENPQQMLSRERLDMVQVCCRPDRIPHWTQVCLEHGIPVVAEKPLAMDMPTLEALWKTAQKTHIPLVPMHTQRDSAALATVASAVRAGLIGEPLVSFSQKSYKWGAARPPYYNSRRTFPGIAPYIGIHAFDWLHWILGDVFTEVRGREGVTARPEVAACASQAALVLTMRNGGVAAVTLDYLRPAAAPTHGDERVRIAGTAGVIETALNPGTVELITHHHPPKPLPTPAVVDLFTRFVHFLQKVGDIPIPLRDSFRITEIAIKAQQAMDTGRTVTLEHSPFVEE